MTDVDDRAASDRARTDARSGEAMLANPGFGQLLHRAHGHDRVDRGRGLARRAARPYGPLALDPATAVLPLRAGDLRGAQGLPARRTARSCTFRPEANAARFHRSARRMAMPELPVETFLERCRRARATPTATGCRRGDGQQPLPAPVHVRHRGGPRRAAPPASTLLRDRLAGRRLLRRRRQAGLGLAVARTTPARRPAAPALAKAAATTPPASSPSSRPSSTAATRSSSSTRSSTAGSRRSAA